VIETCAELADTLLRACADLKVLATSREALGVQGEAVFPITPLALPTANSSSPEQALEAESVRLFVERARAAKRDFDLTARNSTAVVTICRELEGIPLALELAAARVKVLTVDQILAKLGDRFRLLSGGARGTSGRQQTLRATLDWSYDLLVETEKVLFSRLSVFVGGATLEAVEDVCGGGGLDEFEIIDGLMRLTDKSLVAVNASQVEARYYLLETIRQYAAQKLDESGESQSVQRRHRDYFLELAESKGSKLRTSEGAAYGAILSAEIENLRTALAWSRAEPGDGVPFLRLAAGLHLFFYERLFLTEGRAWLEDALARAGDGAMPELRALALTGAGNIANDQGDLTAAYAHHSAALAIYESIGNAKGIAACRHNSALLLQKWGRFADALRNFEESYAAYREIGSTEHCGASLLGQGSLALDVGEWDRADALLADAHDLFSSIGYTYGVLIARMSQAHSALWRGDFERLDAMLADTLALSRQVENRHGIAMVDLLRGAVALERGDLGSAEALCGKALVELREIGDTDSSGLALMYLARVDRLWGATDRATDWLRESLESRVRMGDRTREADCLAEAAALSLARGDVVVAATLLGAARGIRERTGAALQSIERGVFEATRAGAMAALGEAAFQEADQAGAGHSSEEARALALALLTPSANG
jgi:predicted ATPase